MKKIIKQLMILVMAFILLQSINTEVQAATTYRTKSMSIKYQNNKKVSIKPINFRGNISWKTSNSSVFAIDSQGNGTIKGIGKATVTGTGTYQGKTFVMKYKITIIRPKLKTLKIIFAERYRNGAGSSTVFATWKKDKVVDGYEFQMSTSNDFSKNHSETFRCSKKLKEKYGTLKNGDVCELVFLDDTYDQTYDTVYIRVRSYIKINNKKYYYSNWSSVKKVKKRYASSKMKNYISLYPD